MVWDMDGVVVAQLHLYGHCNGDGGEGQFKLNEKLLTY